MREFEVLLHSVVARGLDEELLAPGGDARVHPDVPESVAATYSLASGMNLKLWRKRHLGMPAELLPMAEFFNESQSREFAAMSLETARYVGLDDLWDPLWWPILSSSPTDAVAVHRGSGEVWFTYFEAGIREVIAPSLGVYWSACARWVENFSFDGAEGLWHPLESYHGCEGPWNPNDLGTGFTTTMFPSVDE